MWSPINGGTYLLTHFLGNFREKTTKVPTRTVSRKLSKVSLKFPKNFQALLPLTQLRTGNFFRFHSPITTHTVSEYLNIVQNTQAAQSHCTIQFDHLYLLSVV